MSTQKKGEPRVLVTMRVSRGSVAVVDALAEQEKRSRSQMMRLLLEDGIKARGKK